MPQKKGNETFIKVTPQINKEKTIVNKLQGELNSLGLKITPEVDFKNIEQLKKELKELQGTKVLDLKINDQELINSISNVSNEYINKLSSALSSKALDNEVKKIDSVFENLNKTTLKELGATLTDIQTKISVIGQNANYGEVNAYADAINQLTSNLKKFSNLDDGKIDKVLEQLSKKTGNKNMIKFNVGFRDDAYQTLRQKANAISKKFERGSFVVNNDAKLANVNTVRFGVAFKDDAAEMLARQVTQLQAAFDQTQQRINLQLTRENVENNLQQIVDELNNELNTNPRYKLNLEIGLNNLREQVESVNKVLKQIKIPEINSVNNIKDSTKSVDAKSKNLKEYKKVNENLVNINNTLTGIADKLNTQKEANLRLDKESLAVMQQITAEAIKQKNLQEGGTATATKTSKTTTKSSDQKLTDNQVIKKLKSYSNEIIKAEIALANTDKANKELYAAREKVVDSVRKQYETEQKNLKLTKQQKQVANENLDIRLKAAQETNKASVREQEALNKVAKLQHDINTIRTDALRNRNQYNLFKPDDIEKVAKIEERLNKAQSSLTQLNTSLNNHDLSSFDTMYISDSVNAAKNLGKALTEDTEQAGKIAKNVSKLETQGARLSQYFNKYNSELKKHSELYQKFLDLQFKLNNGLLTEPQAKTAVSSLLIEARAAGVEVDNLWRKLQRTFGSRVRSWVAGDSLFLITSSLRQIYQNVVQIDTAMTELRKVTDATSKEYIQFLDDAETRARRLGATLVETVNASADMARLGYNLQDASALADTAIVYSNVGDDVESIDEASKSIISTMQGFNIEAKNSMEIIDKFNEVANHYASSAGDIGEIVKRSAAAMKVANSTLDETIALGVTANEVLQDSDVVGTALKTMSMRLRSSKSDLEQAGEDTEGMADSVSKLRKEILALSGVDIMLDENTFKTPYRMLIEIGKVWDNLTDINRANIGELLFGKRQASVGFAIIENYKRAEEILKTSQESAGKMYYPIVQKCA